MLAEKIWVSLISCAYSQASFFLSPMDPSPFNIFPFVVKFCTQTDRKITTSSWNQKLYTRLNSRTRMLSAKTLRESFMLCWHDKIGHSHFGRLKNLVWKWVFFSRMFQIFSETEVKSEIFGLTWKKKSKKLALDCLSYPEREYGFSQLVFPSREIT